MPCEVILDLKPLTNKFDLLKSGKAAVLSCVFSGKFKAEHTIEIELLLTRRAGSGSLQDRLRKSKRKSKMALCCV